MKHNKKLLSLFFIIIIFIVSLYYKPNSLKTSVKSVKNTVKTSVTDKLEVYFIDVGQGDSILIKEQDNNVLIDAGNNQDGALLVNYFNDLGIDKFDYLIGTHAHEDHIGGLDDIINNFEVENIYMPKVLTTTKTFEDVLDAVKNKGLSISTPNTDYEFRLNDAKFKVLAVDNEAKDLNDSSIVLKLSFGNNKFLFMGDATKKVEKTLLDKDISADILKVGHHGSEYSSSLEFLKKVHPRYAMISCGANNIYKHPKDVTLESLESLNIDIYRTDLLGTIIAVSDGNNIKISYEETNTNG